MDRPSFDQPFLDRVADLPVLGFGVSTEYGAGATDGALDVLALRRAHPDLAAFLELGVETAKGLDNHARAWVAAGLPTTWHFLDVNLDEPEDLDDAWLAEVRQGTSRAGSAWLCGDAGLWHFGPRGRGHMLLLPPVLTDASATALAEGVVTLRDAVGLEALPENPPGVAFVGDLHLLEFFARVAERADTGLLLDVAHLAIYQRATGHSPLDGLSDFPLERVVEVHVAGGVPAEGDGFAWVEDDHSTAILPDTWQILEAIAPRAPNLRAVVFECERNPLTEVVPVYERIVDVLSAAPLLGPLSPEARS